MLITIVGSAIVFTGLPIPHVTQQLDNFFLQCSIHGIFVAIIQCHELGPESVGLPLAINHKSHNNVAVFFAECFHFLLVHGNIFSNTWQAFTVLWIDLIILLNIQFVTYLEVWIVYTIIKWNPTNFLFYI